MDYAKYVNEKQTPQSHPIPGSSQIPNSAGGHAWAVDDWTRLDRFLVLGTDGGSYYATERKLTTDAAACVLRCVQADGLRTVARIVEVSEAGRAPKNDPAILALACAAKKGDAVTRALALQSVSRVCRIGTHLFHFAQYLEAYGGWGRGTRKAVARWYDDKKVDDLAYQLAKYQGRDGWSHRDLLRLSKPKKASGARDIAYHWATRGEAAVLERHLTQGGAVGTSPLDCDELRLIHAFEQAKESTSVAETVRLIRDHRLPRECVKTEHLNSPEVWEALLPGMKPEALIRNLGKMSAVGLLRPMSAAEGVVAAKLTDKESLVRSRLHPVKVLAAMLTYGSGHGVRGSLTWSPVRAVIDALDAAFYACFGAIEPTGLRTMLALDVSGSMGGGEIAGVPGLSPRVGSAAMALIAAATEPRHMVVGFTAGNRPTMHGGYPVGLSELAISPRQRLDDAVRTVSNLPFGGTDCALPMIHALDKGLEIDTFVIYTDSETWAGNVHPAQALKQYRQKTGIAAKLIVVGMIANEFTIADPNDSGMLDVVGFDTAAPQVMSDFARKEVR